MNRSKLLLALLALFLLGATPEPDRVVIRLTTAQGVPRPGAVVRLALYDVNTWPVVEAWHGSCVTDLQGMCVIEVPAEAPRDPSGFLRGRIEVEGLRGARSVLWPGGILEINLWTLPEKDVLDLPGHPPFDNETPAAPPGTTQPTRQRMGSLFFLVALVPLGLVVYIAWRRQK